MTQVTETDLLRLTGASHTDIVNWIGRLDLATKYEKGQGRARQFSRDNALEIALMTRFIKVDHITAAAAAERVKKIFKKLKRDKPYGWVTFINDPRFFPQDIVIADKPPSEEFLRKHKFCHVINIGEIKERVDELFEKKEPT